ncbi:MAG: hypothetical protein ABSG59_00975 [Verrucomicrobiota bacterium]
MNRTNLDPNRVGQFLLRESSSAALGLNVFPQPFQLFRVFLRQDH